MKLRDLEVDMVRRDLRLLQAANLEEVLSASFQVLYGKRPKQKVQLLESLKRRRSNGGKFNFLEQLIGVAHLLSQGQDGQRKSWVLWVGNDMGGPGFKGSLGRSEIREGVGSGLGMGERRRGEVDLTEQWRRRCCECVTRAGCLVTVSPEKTKGKKGCAANRKSGLFISGVGGARGREERGLPEQNCLREGEEEDDQCRGSSREVPVSVEENGGVWWCG
ncbi:hypothetical protein HAX54_048406 [Datura stramonium]|uniref:Uncharacterized protein n=1 Tax=Datura stramonium TaxID=4076 RepID=A0ABS8STW2_DATST|nr:hypothetical protein [Datura stramonium]